MKISIVKELVKQIEDNQQESDNIDNIKLEVKYFQEKFKPSCFEGLDGGNLFNLLAGGKDHESLSYWLKYKCFGRIGRSDYFLVESCKQGNSEAIKNELITGYDILSDFSSKISLNFDDYLKIEREILKFCPSYNKYAWAHKYFSSMFPEILDEIHIIKHKKTFLEYLGKTYKPQNTHYSLAYHFISLANDLNTKPCYLVRALYKELIYN